MLTTERQVRETRDGYQGGKNKVILDHAGIYNVNDTETLRHTDTYIENDTEIMICYRLSDNAIVHINIIKLSI